MTPLPTGPHGRFPHNLVAVVDTETTGLSIATDRICSVGIVALAYRDCRWREVAAHEWLVDPCVAVGDRASAVNGFDWNHYHPTPGKVNLAGLNPFPFAAYGILAAFGHALVPTVCHNAPFDLGILDAELNRHDLGRRLWWPGYADTKAAFGELLGLPPTNAYRKETSLDALCTRLGVSRAPRLAADGSERTHSALADARLTAACFALLEPLGWMRLACPSELPRRRLKTAA